MEDMKARRTHLSERGRRECAKLEGAEEKLGSFPTEQTTFQNPIGEKKSLAYLGNIRQLCGWCVCVGRARGHTERKWLSYSLNSVGVCNPQTFLLLHTILILQTRPLTFGNVKHLVCVNNWPTWALNLFIPFLKPISLSSVCTMLLPRPRNSDFIGNLLIVVELRRNQIERFYILLFVWFLFLSLSKIHLAKVGRNLPTSFALLLNGFSRLKSPSPR